ncbi:[citrate (pro-3S)-lyase] ligase [Suttonella ornithocola]|uniref:[Citrate [pro-3S]-lyase] ligase n=1 Tax=Suttonella ornithocola TaxID=279832 RepID=A0A380MLX8_9GAMM|nr:[citrate (pro-3S)-lyase] ligase [Suttonella ornithocola]SUO93322.1 [Citrate [pro-3S]-lyase] ligase [Suttonella ornithocola]
MQEQAHEFERMSLCDEENIKELKDFLYQNELNLDDFIELFLVKRNEEGKIIACGGIAPNVIKCFAIDSRYRGQGIALSLASQLIQEAAKRGYHQLFIYTKPKNADLFAGCGFYPIEQVPNQVLLLENSPVKLKRYQQQLRQLRQPGQKIGAIVMNANPFTLGHRYLVETALSQCDWLHLFVVGEDKSQFSYLDRLALVKAGTADLSRLTIHEGTPYIISRATFPCYFLKYKNIVHQCHMELDLRIFRRFIAPPLGITHRFVGNEPTCIITNYYNQQMQIWLQSPEIDAPIIEKVEIRRVRFKRDAISASKVRALLAQGNLAAVQHYVPQTTYDFLRQYS